MPPPRHPPPMADEKDAPYDPDYKGFDVERTRNAQATGERARETADARGEDANAAYVDEGPAEAARRTGDDDLGAAIEKAGRRDRDKDVEKA